MDDQDEYGADDHDDPRPTRPTGETVRIIGAEEAATAIESGHAAGRQPDDAPRFGDVPPAPEGPRPGVRFPLPESADAAELAASTPPPVEMPHWSEPPTGEVPRILPESEDDDLAAWSSFSGGPRWRDTAADWDDSDDDHLMVDDDELGLGALSAQRTEHSDLYSFDEPEFEPDPEPSVVPARDLDPEPVAAARPAPRVVSTRPQRVFDEPVTPPRGSGGGGGGGRDLGTALATGLGVGALALILFKMGPGWALLLATTVVTLSLAEAYALLRKATYRPAVLLGLTGCVSLMLASYKQGETALPMVLSVLTVFTFLWFMARVEPVRPTMNILATIGPFMWIGFLGSFAALLLGFPNRHGIAFLLGAILCTVANDAGAYFTGSRVGGSKMAPTLSPNKTWEGFIGGLVASVIVGVVVVGSISPWGRMDGFWLGLVASVVGPLGDLSESMIKRDLGTKDSGSILPGHGGLLDRFDALLFVLPATYFLVRLLNVG